MAFIYPELPQFFNLNQMKSEDVYNEMIAYSSKLKFLLEQRDLQQELAPASRIYTVVSVTEIGRPQSGDVAFSASVGKFKGYVSGTGWVDFN